MKSETISDKFEMSNNCVASNWLIRKISEYQRNLGADYEFMIQYDPGRDTSSVTEFSNPPMNNVTFANQAPKPLDTSMILIVLSKHKRNIRRAELSADIKSKTRRNKNRGRASGTINGTRRIYDI